METIIETWGKSNFKDEIYSYYSGDQFFSIFSDIF